VPRRRLRRLYAASLALWERARREHSSPRELGLSIGVGVFAGCTPLYGAHMWVALGLATVLRLNRLWAFVGSRVSFTPVFAWIAFCEIESAHRLRTGEWAPLSPREALSHGRELLADWMLGTLLVGVALGSTVGLIAYGLARCARGHAWGRPPAALSAPAPPPAAARPPSSGSPP
jgi:uncharacterized protein (DUF2062 family)